MSRWGVCGLFIVICVTSVAPQVPQRLQIPGALLVGGARQPPLRSQSVALPQRLRSRPAAFTPKEVRPVVEDIEEPNYPSIAPSPSPTSAFDDEVNKLGGFSLQSLARDDEEERATPLPFRPERPVPIGRDQIREKTQNLQARPSPVPQLISRPALRQDFREDAVPVRQAPLRQQQQQQVTRPAPVQNFRSTPVKLPVRQPAFEGEEDDLRERRRKPVSQILRKYRTDNEDGSITWGFENDDGTFKEETLGVDCIIRGKYGYIDPDDVKREFSYEAGNKCDEPEPEEEEELIPRKPNIPQKKPLPYRPAAQPQYVN